MNKNFFKSVCVAASALAVFAAASYSQEKKEADAPHKIIHFADLKWTPILKGCELAPLSGDPNADVTPFVIRIRCADGAKIPAHWHPVDENITVMKGTFMVGMGDAFDESKMQTMNVGNFLTMTKEMHHFGLCKGETIVQVHGMGPFKINWVKPSEVQPPDAPAAAAKP